MQVGHGVVAGGNPGIVEVLCAGVPLDEVDAVVDGGA